MRTTLVIDDDVLQAAREMALLEKTTAGQILSRLARKGLTSRPKPKVKYRNGIPVFPARGETITIDHINRMMDQEGI